MAGFNCVICNIILSKADIPHHLIGKRHLKKIELMEQQGNQIPETMLMNQQETVNASPKNEPLSSKTSEEVKKVVAQPHKKMPVKNREKRKLGKDEHANPKCSLPSAIVDKSKPFEEQVNDFISQVQQTESERMKINKVLFDVAHTFSTVMPGVMPVLYGSQATGLAYRTSDIDVYLCNPQGEENRDFIKQHGRAIHRTRLFSNVIFISHARVPVIKAKHIKTGIELDISATSSQAVSNTYGRDEAVEFIEQHGRVIYKSRLFSDIVLITKARVPIIRARHVETKIQLDISATSGQAVANSTLIYFLMSHDKRIRQLMMLIGYCVKKRLLISTSQFKIYSINLLIIFYLQTLEKPILPPLKKLLYGIPGKTWPFCISHNASLLHNENDMHLDELFIGFFKFYKTFPFSTHLISTYYGDKISKNDLESSHILESMFYYKIYMLYTNDKMSKKTVCIQDPFILEFNTSAGVTPYNLDKFLSLCDDISCMKTKYKVQDWMNEILNGEVAKPSLEAKPMTLLLILQYPISPNWTKNFESDFIMFMSLLHINDSLKSIQNEKIVKEDVKKGEQTNICFLYSLKTTVFPFTPANRELFVLLKRNTINLDDLSKKFKLGPKDTSFNLSMNFTARSKKKGKISLKMENNGDTTSYRNFTLKFKKFFKLFLFFKNEKQTSVETPVSQKLEEIPDIKSGNSIDKRPLRKKSLIKESLEVDTSNLLTGELIPLRVDRPRLLTPDKIELQSQDSPTN